MREIKKTAAPKEDMFVKLTMMQIVLAVLLGGLFFGAYKLNGEYFSQLRSGFLLLMAEDRDIDDYIPYSFMKDETTEKTQTTEEGTSEETAKPPEKESEKTEESTAEEAGTAAEEEETAEEQTGAGGEDSEVSETVSAVNTAALNGLEAVLPVNGTFSSFFGNRVHPVYGTEGFHSGLDIASSEGTPVLAALDGVVEMTGVGEMSGNYVKLDNGNGVETLYCHCSSVEAEKGQTVKRGDVIAYVGQTGLATGPHLHFELHIDGIKCDPALLLDNAVTVS